MTRVAEVDNRTISGEISSWLPELLAELPDRHPKIWVPKSGLPILSGSGQGFVGLRLLSLANANSRGGVVHHYYCSTYQIDKFGVAVPQNAVPVKFDGSQTVKLYPCLPDRTWFSSKCRVEDEKQKTLRSKLISLMIRTGKSPVNDYGLGRYVYQMMRTHRPFDSPTGRLMCELASAAVLLQLGIEKEVEPDNLAHISGWRDIVADKSFNNRLFVDGVAGLYSKCMSTIKKVILDAEVFKRDLKDEIDALKVKNDHVPRVRMSDILTPRIKSR